MYHICCHDCDLEEVKTNDVDAGIAAFTHREETGHKVSTERVDERAEVSA
jgi:hypothetical protein